MINKLYSILMFRTSAFATICVLATFSAIPVGHSLVILLKAINDPWLAAGINITIGLSGFVIIWLGIRRQELQASVYGFIGAHFVFVGFFEFGFALFSKLLNIEAVLDPKTGEVLLSPGLQIVESTIIFIIPLFLLLFLDASVRCNMIVWLRKRLKINPGPAAANGKPRQFAKIAANETLFIILIVYAISLLTLDPRILGPTHILSMLIYTGFLIWPIYLMFRIIRIRKQGAAFRYAIPTGILLWSWVEMLASMNLITEYFVLPFDYPIATGLTIVASVSLLWLVYRGSDKPEQTYSKIK